VECLKL